MPRCAPCRTSRWSLLGRCCPRCAPLPGKCCWQTRRRAPGTTGAAQHQAHHELHAAEEPFFCPPWLLVTMHNATVHLASRPCWCVVMDCFAMLDALVRWSIDIVIKSALGVWNRCYLPFCHPHLHVGCHKHAQWPTSSVPRF